MKHLLGALALTASISAALPVRADVVDMAQATCRDILNDNDEEAPYYVVWLLGFFAGKSGDTALDSTAIETAFEKVSRQCRDNPDAKVMDMMAAALTR